MRTNTRQVCQAGCTDALWFHSHTVRVNKMTLNSIDWYFVFVMLIPLLFCCLCAYARMGNNISAIEDNRPSGRHAQQHEPPQYAVPLSVETHTLNRSSTSPAGTSWLHFTALQLKGQRPFFR